MSPGESETEFRLFVPGPKESTLEVKLHKQLSMLTDVIQIIYDLKEAIEERKKGNDEFEIKLMLKIKPLQS